MVFSELSRYLHSAHTVLSESIISDVDIHCALLLDCAKADVASNLVHIGRVSDCKKPCNASNLILVGNDNPPEWIKLYNYIHTSVSYNKRLDLFHNTFDSIAVFLN